MSKRGEVGLLLLSLCLLLVGAWKLERKETFDEYGTQYPEDLDFDRVMVFEK